MVGSLDLNSLLMKRLLVGVGIVVVVMAAGVAVFETREPRIRANSFVGTVGVGGLTRDQAKKAVRAWWESNRKEKLKLELEDKTELGEFTATSLGVSVDDDASVAQLRTIDPIGGLFESKDGSKTEVQIRYKKSAFDAKQLKTLVDSKQKPATPALVTFADGQILARKETSRMSLNESLLYDAVVESLGYSRRVVVPVVEAKKKVPDDAVESIKEVVSTFTTRFSAGNRPRSSNIKMAASKFNGIVLLPGEKISFNDTVGRRTLKAGFKLAGVYVNGKHDTGIGGGICQVSTTLYNSALFANLKVLRRSNHSLPVPYVPPGRDATVDYGSLDLVLLNSGDKPISVVSEYKPGALTFRILGTKVPGLEVKVSSSAVKSKPRGTKISIDRNLPANSRVVVEKGSPALSCFSYRTVYKDGVLVSKETLGRSVYGGADTVITVGPTQPKKVAVKATTPPPTTLPPERI